MIEIYIFQMYVLLWYVFAPRDYRQQVATSVYLWDSS